MIFQIAFILCVATIHVVLGEVWEFGENVPSSRVVSHNEGYMSLLDKRRSILLTVPQCYEIDYVRVEVNNMISNPAVTYDRLTQVVNIAYKPLQLSMSTYSVVAKAKEKDSCEGRDSSSADTLALAVFGLKDVLDE